MIHDRVLETDSGGDAHLREVQHALHSELVHELGRRVWRTWFRDTDVVRVESERVVLAVPTEVHRTWIEYTFGTEVRHACSRVLGEGVAVVLEVGARAAGSLVALLRELVPELTSA